MERPSFDAVSATLPPAQPNQSLIDGLACLQALAVAERPIGSREMGRQLNLESTRVNRLLKTLAHLGIAQQTPNRRYVPGPGMHVIAAQAMFGSGLLRRSVGPLNSLRDFKLTVAMGVLWHNHVAYLFSAKPNARLGEAVGRIGLFAATRTGIGMVLLSRMKPRAVRELYRGEDIPNYSGIEALLRELKSVRDRGYALVRPSADEPTQIIAVGVENEAAGIALTGEFKAAERPALLKALRSAAAEIGATAARSLR